MTTSTAMLTPRLATGAGPWPWLKVAKPGELAIANPPGRRVSQDLSAAFVVYAIAGIMMERLVAVLSKVEKNSIKTEKVLGTNSLLDLVCAKWSYLNSF